MFAKQLTDDEVPVAEAIARVLEAAGVDFVFGMPGGRTIPIYDALYDHSEKVRCVLVGKRASPPSWPPSTGG